MVLRNKRSVFFHAREQQAFAGIKGLDHQSRRIATTTVLNYYRHGNSAIDLIRAHLMKLCLIQHHIYI